MSLYIIRAVESVSGDFEHILQHGMSQYFARLNGCVQLARTGPEIAPITFPGQVIVTQDFRLRLEKSELTGFSFRPVIKHHIVENERLWEENLEQFIQEFPDVEEPEDALLKRPHSASTAEALGPLWELIFQPDGVQMQREGEGLKEKLFFIESTWTGFDFFQPTGTRLSCVSEKARCWLEPLYGDYLEFHTHSEFRSRR